jgi:WD40 repeat protein
MWDAETGREITVLRGHEDAVYSAAFGPDGERILTASRDGTARVWEAETGEELTVLRGPSLPCLSARFSPDGQRIVTVSYTDPAVRVWDVATGEEVAVLRGHEHHVYSAAFAPDGVRIVTASRDYTARIWDSVPYVQRYAERRERERAARLVEPVVDRLFVELVEPRSVAEAVRKDVTLTDLQRRVALDLVLARSSHLREQQDAE